MECKYCKSTWNSTIKVESCPFCGNALMEIDEYTISSALKKIINDKGIEILNNSDMLIAYIMDYVKGDERNKKLLRIAAKEGILELMLDVKNSEKIKQEGLIIRAVKVLEEDAFLSTENAVHIIGIISEGLDLEFENMKMYKKTPSGEIESVNLEEKKENEQKIEDMSAKALKNIVEKVEKKMALLKEWHKLAYNEQADQGEMQRFWTSYFLKEQSVYEKLLSNPEEVVEGTVKELAEKYELSIMEMTGFLDGINDCLVAPNPIDDMEEDTQVSLAFDKEKLYKGMVAAKAEWLYELPMWDDIFDKETQKRLYLEQKKSGTVVKEQKVGRNGLKCTSGECEDIFLNGRKKLGRWLDKRSI